MHKDKLLAALDAMQDGADAGAYHDELETLIDLVRSASDGDITTAWERLKAEPEETE